MSSENMWHRKKWTKGNFRIRLLLTISAFVCLPLFLLNVYVVNNNMHELEKQSTEAYREYTDRMSQFFGEQVEQMFFCSVKVSNNRVIAERALSENKTYLRDAFSEVEKYYKSVAVADDMYVYIQSMDYLIGADYGYDSSYFAKLFLGEERQWFDELSERYEDSRYFVPCADDRRRMFAVFPVSVCKTGDSAVFFSVTTESLGKMFYKMDGADTGLYLYNSAGELLLSDQPATCTVTEQAGFLAFLEDGGLRETEMVIDGTVWCLYKTYDSENDLCFVTTVSREELLGSVRTVEKYNRMLLLMEFILCICMMIFVVYVNYRPIHILKRNYIDEDLYGKGNEIEAIARLIDKKIVENSSLEELVKERTNQLSVYVLRDMLDGAINPQISWERQGWDETYPYAFVMSVSGIETDSAVEKKMVETLTEERTRTVHMMVDSYEHCLLFVCMVKDARQSIRMEMAETLGRVIEHELKKKKYKIGVGEYSNVQEGLQNAKVTSLIAMDQGNYGEIVYYENAVSDFKQIEYYPNQQVLVYMRQLKEGNAAYAIPALEQLMMQVKALESIIIQRYVCYDIVNELMKQTALMNVKMEEVKILSLMRFEKPEHLQEMLAEMTISICMEIKERKLRTEKEQARRIIQFIDENITNPDLSREMIADRFKISVDAVTLLCSNVIGVGFRELIVMRRIDLAQKLLQETNLSVNEVALQSGFRNTSYFIKIFKNLTGKTPKIYKMEQHKTVE